MVSGQVNGILCLDLDHKPIEQRRGDRDDGLPPARRMIGRKTRGQVPANGRKRVRNPDIQVLVSSHVETVCLLSKLSETKNHISVKVDMDEMDVTAAESKASRSPETPKENLKNPPA